MDDRITSPPDGPQRTESPSRHRDFGSDRAAPRRRLIARALLPVLILAGAIAIMFYLVGTRPTVERTPPVEREWVVDALVAKVQTIVPTLHLYGTVVAGREVDLRPLLPGTVAAVHDRFVEGGAVPAGTVLVRLDPFEHEATLHERRAQLSEARGRLDELLAEVDGERSQIDDDEQLVALRQRELDRRVDLRKRGSGTEKAVDDATLALNETRQRLADRRKRIAMTEARIIQQRAAVERAEVAVNRAERDLRDTELRAPFDAFVVEPSVAAGKRIGVTDRVARLIDARRLEVRFQISDAQYGRLVEAGPLAGRKVRIEWRSRARTLVHEGLVERVSGQVAQNSTGIDVFARIAGTDLDTVLRPGVFVEIAIDDRPYDDIVVLPDEALQDERTVYAVVDGRLVARAVEIVGRSGNDVLVRGEVVTGDRIVTRVFPEIGPGVKVSIRE